MPQHELNSKINELFLESVEKINTFTPERREKTIRMSKLSIQDYNDFPNKYSFKPYNIILAEKLVEYYNK